LQEAENQIITHCEVYPVRPSDQHLLLPAVEVHRRELGRVAKSGADGKSSAGSNRGRSRGQDAKDASASSSGGTD
jgi:hypothetical protein